MGSYEKLQTMGKYGGAKISFSLMVLLQEWLLVFITGCFLI